MKMDDKKNIAPLYLLSLLIYSILAMYYTVFC